MRCLRPAALAQRLGMDVACIAIDGPDCAAWRAASGHTFDGSALRIVLSQAALARLGVTGDIVIELAMNPEALCTALSAIFAIEPSRP